MFSFRVTVINVTARPDKPNPLITEIPGSIPGIAKLVNELSIIYNDECSRIDPRIVHILPVIQA